MREFTDHVQDTARVWNCSRIGGSRREDRQWRSVSTLEKDDPRFVNAMTHSASRPGCDSAECEWHVTCQDSLHDVKGAMVAGNWGSPGRSYRAIPFQACITNARILPRKETAASLQRQTGPVLRRHMDAPCQSRRTAGSGISRGLQRRSDRAHSALIRPGITHHTGRSPIYGPLPMRGFV